ncbi:helical backbone metal receptor [Cytobacillus sp. Hz8]|uniref:ABC transporter substrate-binding protein n=1 Tax=Cytobacillus sp. Hz8 TaxID=3347168 RepID=UPI0035D7D7A3
MKKWYSYLFALILLIGVLTGCNADSKTEKSSNSNKTEQKAEALFPVTIKDAVNKEVKIDKKPERIVSLMPSNTEVAFKLGLGDKMVGVSDNDTYPEEVAKIDKVGGMELNIEKIISLKPDLVLAHASSAHNSTEGLQQLRDAGISVLVVNDAQNFAQVYQSIDMIGKATGEVDKANEVIQSMKDKIAEIKEKAAAIKEKKSVYIEVSPAPDNFTTGKNTFMNEMLTMINADNVAGDLEGWVKVDQEAIIKKNPDVIISTYGSYEKNAVDKIMKRKGWQDVKAVKNKQIFDVNPDIVTRSGPRLAEGVEELAKAIYPENFK